MSNITKIWPFLLLLLALSVWCFYAAYTIQPAFAQDKAAATPSPSASPSTEKLQSEALQQYRQILDKERKLLEEQSERYYTRIEKLAYIVLGALSIALISLIGFFSWMFGQTRKDVITSFAADLEKNVFTPAREDLTRVTEAKLNQFKSDLERLSASDNKVMWLLPQSTNIVDANGNIKTEISAGRAAVITALQAVGLRDVRSDAFAVSESAKLQAALKDAKLVILSFDGSQEAKSLLKEIAKIAKPLQPPVSFLIYTYKFYFPDGRPLQLGKEEFDVLDGLASFAPANFPATLVSQAQSLSLRKNG